MESSSSPSSFPPVDPRHCSNVPVLFELLKGEEEQCRVWLRSEMKQIPDPLIDSLFARLIMSSSSSSSVPQSVSELCELLEGEKVETRKVLRSEMDRLVNTLFEKLINNLRTNTDLNRSEDGGERAQVADTLDRVKSANAISKQPSSLIAQPSTSSLIPVAHHQQHGNEKELTTVEMVQIKEEVEDGEETRIIDGSRSVENAPMDWVKQEIKEEFVDGEETRLIDIEDLAEDNHGGDDGSQSEKNEPMDWVKREIKEEEEDGEMMQEEEEEETNEVDLGNANEDGEADEVNRMSMNNLNEPTRANLELMPISHQIPNADVSLPNAPSNSNEDDDDDQVDEKSSRPVKRPRMNLSVDSTQQINAQPKVESQPTDAAQPNQVNIQDNHIITLRLQCPELGCSQMFVPKPRRHVLDQLNDHLKYRHSIGSYRCMFNECRQSFDNHHTLGRHINKVHPNITRWHCGECSKHYAKYRLLSQHKYQHHQLGHFQCAFPACTFTGEYKVKVHNHYRQQHKEKLDFLCRQSGCDFRTKDKASIKAHELSHVGIKPYRCKWPNCDYASAWPNSVLNHITKTHFNSTKSSSQDLTHIGKPSDYIEQMG